MSEPRTMAGKALLASLGMPADLQAETLAAILAIEAEAWNDAMDHAARTVDSLVASSPAASPATGEGLRDADIERLVHVLGCPRWDAVPADECVYRGIHVEDAQRKGPALRAALAATTLDPGAKKPDPWFEVHGCRIMGASPHDSDQGSLCTTHNRRWRDCEAEFAATTPDTEPHP